MVKKVFNVFYDDKGYPFKDQPRKTIYPVVGGTFMGASNTTEIRFYIDKIGNTSATWVAITKLPNGKVGSQVLETAYDSELEEYYAYLQLNSWYTQLKGDIYISLNGYQGGIELEYDEDTGLYSLPSDMPTIQATGSVKLSILYATRIIGGEEIDAITLQDIYALFGDKLNIKDGMVVIESRSVPATNYENGQVVYSKGDNKFYEVVNGDYDLALDPATNHSAFISISSTAVLLNGYAEDLEKELVVIYYNGEVLIKSKNNIVIGSDNYYLFLKVDEIGQDSYSGYDSYTKNGLLVNKSTYAISTYNISLGSYYTKSGADGKFATISNLNVVSNLANENKGKIDTHIADKNNPHEVTKTQLGLGNVDNTSDNNKPVSNAQQAALDLKANKADVYTKTQSDNRFQKILTAGTGISIVGNVISATVGISMQFVNELPQTGLANVFYFIPSEDAEEDNIYDEYVYVNNGWEKIGSTKIDLSDFYTKSEIDTLLGAKQDNLPNAVNGKFLKANSSTGDLEWDSSVQEDTSSYSFTITSTDWEDLKESTSLVLEGVTITSIDSSYDFVRIKLKVVNNDYSILLKKNELNKYVGVFDIEEDDYLYEIGVYYNGSSVILRSSRYNVIPNNALVDSNGNIIVDINGNYLVATEGE